MLLFRKLFTERSSMRNGVAAMGLARFAGENVAESCWKAFKGGGSVILCCWLFYVSFLVLSTHPCWQSSDCLAVLVTRDNTGRRIESVEASSTSLDHIVFGIAASAHKWKQRKPYIDLWWQPGRTRGFVWLDQPVNETSPAGPPIRISEDTSQFNYTHPQKMRSAIRISRIVSETFRLGLPEVRWFVMGDDDTLFLPENLVRVLAKYDHNQYYYIGSNSESTDQNSMHSYSMAYGGGGFAISYPLAKALAQVQDDCLHRYPHLYGSDQRVQACLAELGVPLTKEPGFHQFDIHGNLFGLLAAHPVAPLVSLHHLDNVAPVFPNMTRVTALRHLMRAARVDPDRTLQQSICYDRKRKWTVSVSWGYCVQVFDRIELPRILEYPLQTFVAWGHSMKTPFLFNTRPVPRNPCQRGIILFMENAATRNSSEDVVSRYRKLQAPELINSNCSWGHDGDHPNSLQKIMVFSKKMQPDWTQAPRRHCCEVISSEKHEMEIVIRSCRDGEAISLP